MSDAPENQTETPGIPRRVLAYALVVAIPLLAFVVSANFSYGADRVAMRGIDEAYGLETNEEVVLPGFSVLARLSGGYGAQPGYGMSKPRFDEFAAAAAEDRDFDVVVLGSSHAYRSFDPRIFAKRDLRMFNLGSTAQTPAETLFLLKRFGDAFTVRVAVIEVIPFQLRSGTQSAKSARDLALNLPPDADIMPLAMKAGDFDTTRLAASYLIAERPHFEPVEGGVPLAVISKCWYVPGGYCEWRETAADEQILGEYDFQPTEEGMEALRETTELLLSRDVEVVFVMAPMPRGTLDRARNYAAGRDLVTKMADELGVPLLDYTDGQSPLDSRLHYPSHFYDDHHLNQAGVELFNEQFLDDLAARTDTLD